MHKRFFEVMAAGHLCLDVTPSFPEARTGHLSDLLQPGKLVNVGRATFRTGGAVSNTGLAMRALGNRVSFCARIGEDAFGDLIAARMIQAGSVEGLQRVRGENSSYSIVIAPPGIDRVFLHNPGANDSFSSDDVDAALLHRCRLFHFGYPPLMRRMYENDGEDLERLFAKARKAGAATSCDMALPDPESPAGRADWTAILKRALPHVDYFVPSIEEVLYMVDRPRHDALRAAGGSDAFIDGLKADDLSRVGQRLLDLGARVVLIKLGARGVYLRTANAGGLDAKRLGLKKKHWAGRELWAPAYAVTHFAGANGAGDTLIAGFLTACLKGYGPEEALRCALCCAWCNIQGEDIMTGKSSWKNIVKRVQTGMETIPPGPCPSGWQEEDGLRTRAIQN